MQLTQSRLPVTFRAWCAELVANLAFEMATRTFYADTGGRVAFRLVPLWAATLSIGHGKLVGRADHFKDQAGRGRAAQL